MSATAIAKKTGTKTARVKQGLAVVESSIANAAIVEHQLDLEQAATLIEFEDDSEVTAELIAIAKEQPGQFHHAAQRARNERIIAAKIADTAATLADAGYEVLERRPSYGENEYLSIYQLRTADGARIDEEGVAQLDGRAGMEGSRIYRQLRHHSEGRHRNAIARATNSVTGRPSAPSRSRMAPRRATHART